MTCVEKLAAFVSRASFDQLSPKARDQLKTCVLDALGCGLGALAAEPIRLIREQVDEFGGASLCTLIGGGRTAPDRAGFYNGALVRYLDFNDSFLALGESCHPSDNLSPLLAAAEYAQSTGRDLLTALAVAYQIQCRLSEAAETALQDLRPAFRGAQPPVSQLNIHSAPGAPARRSSPDA